MCDVGVGSMSVSVMTTTNPDGKLPTVTRGSNETLHNTLRIVLPFIAEVSGVVDFSGSQADPVHPIYVLLGLNPAI